MKMKIFIIEKTYSAAINRDKLYHLSKKAEVSLLTPTYWRDDLFTFDVKKDNKIKHYLENIVLNGHERASFYFPKLGMHIKEEKPDIIQVDQGANAVTYFQAITNNKIFSIDAKMCF